MSFFRRIFGAAYLWTLWGMMLSTAGWSQSFNAQKQTFASLNVVTHDQLFLELKVDFDKKELSGWCTYHLKWNNRIKFPKSPSGVLKVNYVMDVKSLDIEKVTDIDYNPLSWKIDSTVRMGNEQKQIFGYPLVIQVNVNQQYVRVKYKTRPESAALQWLVAGQTHDREQPFLFSQSQAILARTWVPCQDAPEVKFIYRAQVDFPGNMNAVMSARTFMGISDYLVAYPLNTGAFQYMQKSKVSNSTDRRLYFAQEQPISTYLLAIAVGKFDFVKLGPNCGVYAETGMLDKAAHEFVDLQRMVDSASALFGKYAWGDYNVLVLPPSFPFGGMENPVVTFATPTIITGDRSLVSLLAHELAHSWSGNLVTNHTWNDFWLNEGFTNYFENRIMEKLYGKDYADMLAVLGKGELLKTMHDLLKTNAPDTRLKIDLTNRNPDDGLTDIAYEKGRFFLVWCEQQLSRPVFDKFLNYYFNKHRFGTNTTEGFIKDLQEFLNELPVKRLIDYGPFFATVNDWIYKPGFPKKFNGKDSSEVFPVLYSLYLKDAENVARMVQPNSNLPDSNQGFNMYLASIVKAKTNSWTTHHYLHFLRNFERLSFATIAVLDSTFHFTKSTNSEIACDWFLLCIRSNYTLGYRDLLLYLSQNGRRKFVLPLYEALLKQSKMQREQGNLQASKLNRYLAEESFKLSKMGYHSVTRESIEQLFQEYKP